MKDINRFYIMGNKLPLDDGPPVSFKDHAAIVAVKDALIAALQDQVRALAAENSIQDFIISAVKDLVRESEGVVGWHLNGDIATWDKVLPELNHSETPATDAALREIRAQAVEEYAITVGAEKNGAIYAASIRAGEQP